MKADPELLEIQEPEEVMHATRKNLRPPVAPKRPVLHSFSGGEKIGMTILAASLGFVLVQLDVSIVNIALAKIGADLGTPVVRQAGGALGVAVYGALLNEKGIAGVQLSFLFSAVLLTIAAFVAAAGINRKK